MRVDTILPSFGALAEENKALLVEMVICRSTLWENIKRVNKQLETSYVYHWKVYV